MFPRAFRAICAILGVLLTGPGAGATERAAIVRPALPAPAEAFPVAFECSGNTRALNEAIRVVRRRGTVVAVGFYQGEAAGLFLGDEFHHNGVEIRSGQIGNLHPRWDLVRLRAFGRDLALGGLVLGGLPRRRMQIDDAREAFAELGRAADTLQVAFSYPDA